MTQVDSQHRSLRCMSEATLDPSGLVERSQLISCTLLLLLSHCSRVRLCATPQTAARQAPPSLGFSRQERWSGLPLPSPTHESESEVAQSCLTLHHPVDCGPPGSSVHGIFQARALEWGAIAFSGYHVYMIEKSHPD